MKKINQHSWTALIVLAAFVALSSFALKPGTHSFQVYLDNKMIADQYVSRNMVVPVVALDPSEKHDDIIVKYSECGKTVSGRTITLKSDRDKVLKDWHFNGTTSGFKYPMTIKVQDIIALKVNDGATLKLVYSSDDFKEGQEIASLVVGKNVKASLK